ncbi:DUF6777 domain-containing protein [Streptomyces beihaiensis]|uniref:DUF6777 domain-containing protein n=1 Tax=Streptomyces beihaiensis TaxID=2984495 RepID=A0ABT3TSN8_9ACTN|nr:DUF6777 domain-containing protein [Streptomyces beihaiensis]MCX3059023.1 hypothetical protein [Streptomyces beihaiensis]
MRARTRTRTYVTALGISAALLLAGCSGSNGGNSGNNASGGKGELFLQPVADQGPDPFTDSTAASAASTPPVTRTPQPTATGDSPSATALGLHSISGATPGLYGGTHAVGSCDVEKQVRFLTADQAKAGAFARAAGVSRGDVPGYLRGLTPVVLRADTRVTNHGYHDGRATSFQSVLQAGTAVLVDNHGMPRVRCACGNPLKPPVAFKHPARPQGTAWSGYEPTKVVVVTPAPQVIQNITIVNVVNNTWIQRKIGDDGRHDHTVPPPTPTPPTPTPPTPTPTSPTPTPTPTPTPDESATSTEPTQPGESETGTESVTPPESSSASPSKSPSETTCPTLTPTDSTGTPSGLPSPWPSGCPTPSLPQTPQTRSGERSTGASEDIGPETVPDTPDQPGDGLIPDATDDTSSSTQQDSFAG